MVLMGELGAFFCRDESKASTLQHYLEAVPSSGTGHIDMFKRLLNEGDNGAIVDLRKAVKKLKVGNEVVSQMASVFAKLSILYHNYLNSDEPIDLTVDQMEEVIKYWFTDNSQVLKLEMLNQDQMDRAIEELSKFDAYFRDDVAAMFMSALQRNMDMHNASEHFRVFPPPEWLDV